MLSLSHGDLLSDFLKIRTLLMTESPSSFFVVFNITVPLTNRCHEGGSERIKRKDEERREAGEGLDCGGVVTSGMIRLKKSGST
jgi:hypothetical protein